MLSQQHDEAGGSLTRETPVRVESSPDNAGTGQYYRMVRVRQARREGVREEPVLKASQVSRQLQSGGYGLACGAYRPLITERELGCRLRSLAVEATVKACGVAVAISQGHSWAPNLPIG
ncbi:hypothetical protein GCM10023063_02270 [Arthrobacter methylotrophus]